MKNKILFLFMVVVLVTSLVIAGCAAPEPTPAPTPTPTPAPAPTPAAERVIKIGISAPLSGFAAAWGIPIVQITEVIADDVAKMGGIDIKGEKYTIEIIAYDDKYEASEGAIIAQRLAYEDEVDAYFGGGGPGAWSGVPVMLEAGILNFNTCWDFEWTAPEYPLNFAYAPRYAEPAVVTWPWIVENYPNVKTVSTLGPNFFFGYWVVDFAVIYCHSVVR